MSDSGAMPFDDRDRKAAASALGMWVFLASEAMLFGAILLVYAILRSIYAETFAEASGKLSLPLGTANTVALITSSFTMALAHHFAVARHARATRLALAATAALGAAFLAVKGVEYWKEYREGLAPVLGAPFEWEGEHPDHAELFFNFYFAMTSLHALHLAAGIGIVLWVLARRNTQLERERLVHGAGLYWHFVDVVWVFLFPVLYLIDR